jgi:hypothetical protein
MKGEKYSAIVPCPDCDNEIYLGAALREGEKITCPICWAYLVITDLDTWELDWDIEEYDDDWDL